VSGKLRQSGAHPIALAPVRQRGGGGGHGVMTVVVLRWSAAATAKGSCSLRGPHRGERRSTTRTTAAIVLRSPDADTRTRGREGLCSRDQ
jgi:hypothetical protein